jgi:GcrA cell cycle regulator
MTFWTDIRLDILKRAWAAGKSANQIADLIGDGCSRNAVIGKVHRLGLAARPDPIVRRPKAVIAYTPRACQWPFGDPKEPGFHFCGKTPEPGRPYCSKHSKLAYRKTYDISPEDRERRRAQGQANSAKRRGRVPA